MILALNRDLTTKHQKYCGWMGYHGDIIGIWLTGWWLTYPSKKFGVKVSWDDDIPPQEKIYIYMESHKIHVPNHQPVDVVNIFQYQAPPIPPHSFPSLLFWVSRQKSGVLNRSAETRRPNLWHFGRNWGAAAVLAMGLTTLIWHVKTTINQHI